MLSRTARHLVRALGSLAVMPPGTYRGVTELAAEVGAPPNYLSKLLQGLTRSGLVLSRKGAGGGFALGRSAERITLLEALDPLEGFDRWKGCLLGEPECSDRTACAVHASWKAVREEYLVLLGKTTLADVSGGGRRKAPPARPPDARAKRRRS